MKHLFLEAKGIIDKLEENGYEAYFVGGSVRDLLIGRPIGDVDIATSAKPEEIQALFRKTIDVGAEHGTIIVLYNEKPFEVTTFRQESEYTDFRRPSAVTFISSLKEDLKRRDFTMNAMAMKADGEIIDYFQGQEAIKTKTIETVGKAEHRFSEDALRMLRAVRFVSQLGFTLHPDTKQAIEDTHHLLHNISVERKAVEFEKLLKGPNVCEGLQLLICTNLYKHLPGLGERKKELQQLATFSISLQDQNELWTFVSYVLNIQEVESFLRSWKLPVKRIKHVQKALMILPKLLNNGWNDFLLYETGIEDALCIERVRQLILKQSDVENFERLKEMYANLPIKNRRELVLNGRDITQIMGLKPGPWVKETIGELERLVVSRQLKNEKDQLKEWLKICNQKLDESF
ncbi:CCA tRNA nucleotidyltransferase [Bacillus sp. FJAT-47783]|uniref:CCA tRNA nucleotidyltransferase n=1 Tax=Bacillus sp. FJAT-47783 TaxID=2922712 RepID=UPI001FAD5DB3|nr:CCA tRNA nucleotidyltransferase [Bacillus sp. FJAT-47783]